MASRRQRAAEPRKNRKAAQPAKASARSTMSGPSAKRTRASGDDEATRKFLGTGELAATRPFNRNKAGEHGQAAHVPETGEHYEAPGPEVTGSTLSESNRSPKTGGRPALGVNAAGGELDRVRADSSGQVLTTNQGVPVGDNQNSLKAGLRGPALLEDFILREKVTHFDHERIPERIVHARGSAAHGFFECYKPLTRLTRASLFAEAGKRTPVFVRFSTVAGERGSTDTARDVRGFAVKFYTDEGNWDLVGNNIPIFFIQDAMKFPDLVHAVKPEPHHGMPQAASAHDTFWDFVSLMPESVHMQMWVMSDRAIPRSYRMMQGFGVHTFRMINARGDSVFVKFHWSPVQGTHSLDWDEAVKISGADPDFHRRDLWEAIEAGAHPEWELGVQVFTEEQAEKFSFDVLDATKLVPEELVRVEPVGRMVLNRNPDNFFAETEQAAFCAAHIVPGLDFTNDPLLAGRIHSYVDTQISRLGGPNFHEIPINAPIAAVHNNQRDGMHRQAVHRGRVAYEPNSLGGGCPFQAGAKGFVSFPQPVREDKVRGKPEKFADHYTQAALFYESQTPVEQAHIVRAFRFELTKVQVPAIRERVVSQLRNVNEDLARQVATGLGIDLPKPQPALRPVNSRAEVKRSPGSRC
jgi:catalase